MAAVHHLGLVYMCVDHRKQYLVISVTVQYLFGIDAVVSIICKFEYFTSYA